MKIILLLLLGSACSIKSATPALSTKNINNKKSINNNHIMLMKILFYCSLLSWFIIIGNCYDFLNRKIYLEDLKTVDQKTFELSMYIYGLLPALRCIISTKNDYYKADNLMIQSMIKIAQLVYSIKTGGGTLDYEDAFRAIFQPLQPIPSPLQPIPSPLQFAIK